MKATRVFFYGLLIGFILSSGCTRKEPLKLLEAVEAEAETRSFEELQAVARKLVLEIYEGKKKLERGEEEFNQLSPEERLSERGKKLNLKLGGIRGDVNGRAQRYHIYADKIRKLGGQPPKFKDVIEE